MRQLVTAKLADIFGEDKAEKMSDLALRTKKEVTIVNIGTIDTLLIVSRDSNDENERSSLSLNVSSYEPLLDAFHANDKVVLSMLLLTRNAPNLFTPLALWSSSPTASVVALAVALGTLGNLVETRASQSVFRELFGRLEESGKVERRPHSPQRFSNCSKNDLETSALENSDDIKIIDVKVDRSVNSREVRSDSDLHRKIGEAAHDFFTRITAPRDEHVQQLNAAFNKYMSNNFEHPTEAVRRLMGYKSSRKT